MIDFPASREGAGAFADRSVNQSNAPERQHGVEPAERE
jgi:hypothetical protein